MQRTSKKALGKKQIEIVKWVAVAWEAAIHNAALPVENRGGKEAACAAGSGTSSRKNQNIRIITQARV